ncbi:MAG: hypothetical protein ACWA5W_08360 [Phycisphaerales bacterium]
MWNQAEIADLMAEELRAFTHASSAKPAHAGIDSLSEIQLHPLLCQSFTNSTFGVQREVRYPSSGIARPNESQRQRCDLVLTPRLGMTIFDPIHEQRLNDELAQTLFAGHLDEQIHNDAVSQPEEAYWIEVKVVGQFQYVDGVPIPNTAYTSELTKGPKLDVIKLASEPMIHAGAVLVVIFTEQENAGPHDLNHAARLWIEQGLPISIPEIRSFPIPNYGGNEWCSIGLIPVKF